MCLLRAILLGLLVLANVALPGMAQSLPARIAFLDMAPPSEPIAARNWQVFTDTLQALGWSDGRNIAVTRRWTDFRDERAVELAAELVAQRPDVIVTAGYPNTKAVRERTADIPIVFINVPNPVGFGFVASLARPGGKITGATGQSEDVIGRALQLIKETRPGISHIAYLGYLEAAYSKITEELYAAAAQRLGLTLTTFGIKSAADVDAVFAGIVRDRPDALVVSSIPALAAHSLEIADFAIDNRLPTFTFSEAMAREGFLMALTADAAGMFRGTATMVDKILKGAKPGEIPVEQPTRFHFVVNLRTARALGIELPPVLLTAADEVIE